MGRTVATYTQMLDLYQQRWNKVRRALRKVDQAEFDRLFEQTRLNIQAGAYAAAPDPKESIYLTMLLGLSKEVTELKQEVQELRAHLQLPEKPLRSTAHSAIDDQQPCLIPWEEDEHGGDAHN